jgi:DNA repair exonuclease SbcCD ATPase subunit
MPTNESNSPTRQELQNAFQQLYDGLTQAYWSASTIEAKDRIYGVEEVVFDVLTDLAREDLDSRTQVYEDVAINVKSALTKLDRLKEDIDQLIHAVKVASEVAGVIDKAVKLATKFFGL